MITFKPYVPGFVDVNEQPPVDFKSIDEMLESDHFNKWRNIPMFTELGVTEDMVIAYFGNDKKWVVGHISGDGIAKAEY